jgi:hypothetical protein
MLLNSMDSCRPRPFHALQAQRVNYNEQYEDLDSPADLTALVTAAPGGAASTTPARVPTLARARVPTPARVPAASPTHSRLHGHGAAEVSPGIPNGGFLFEESTF